MGPHAFWTVWLAFWGELNTPSSYHAEPYYAGANQSGHILIGAALSATACLVHFVFFGEMPYKWVVGVSIVGGYLLFIEYMKQGWGHSDSIVDGAFLGIGVCAPLVALTEDPRTLQLEPNPVAFFWWLFCAVGSLAIYVFPRAARKYGWLHKRGWFQ